MKLSDIKGERCLDVVADLIEPIASMAKDEDVVALFKPTKVPDDETPHEFFADRMRAGLPKLLRNHRSEIIQILASLEGVTPAVYKKTLTMPKLISDTFEVLTDSSIAAFLSSHATTETSSGSASGSTAAPSKVVSLPDTL